MALVHKNAYQNTTVRLPKRIYEQAKMAIRKSEAASSFNEFVVQAIQEKVHKLTEAEIDQAFTQMAGDPEYQQESIALARAFEKSDWESLKATEIAHEHTHVKTRAPKTGSR